MGQVLDPFPDGEEVMMALLRPVAETFQTTPQEITGPMIQVLQTGGSATRFETRPVLSVACFDLTYSGAKRLAAQCEQIVLGAGASTVHGVDGYPNGVYIDRARIEQTPREIPYRDADNRRKTATYGLVMRRPRT